MNVILILTDKNKRQVNLWMEWDRWDPPFGSEAFDSRKWTASLWHQNAAVGQKGLIGFEGAGTWSFFEGTRSIFLSYSFSVPDTYHVALKHDLFARPGMKGNRLLQLDAGLENCMILDDIRIPGVKKNAKGRANVTSVANTYLDQTDDITWECFDVQYE